MGRVGNDPVTCWDNELSLPAVAEGDSSVEWPEFLHHTGAKKHEIAQKIY